jgi:hypothetical protein
MADFDLNSFSINHLPQTRPARKHSGGIHVPNGDSGAGSFRAQLNIPYSRQNSRRTHEEELVSWRHTYFKGMPHEQSVVEDAQDDLVCESQLITDFAGRGFARSFLTSSGVFLSNGISALVWAGTPGEGWLLKN